MNSSLPAPPPISPAHQDRRTGLIVFGIMEIMLGGLFLLALPATIVGQIAIATKGGTDVSLSLLATSLLTPAVLAAGLIWLGIGSISCRRWARALLLCLGWLGLCVGLVSLVVVFLSLGSLEEMLRQQGQSLSPGMIVFTKVVMVATTVVIYVIVPGALVLFYRSPHVRLTCVQRDPVERWTDRCPLPVIAICIMQAYGTLSMLAMLPLFGAAFPLAGFVVTGWFAWALWLGSIGLSAYAAWGFYHLNLRVWLIYTITFLALGVSSVVTFLYVDLPDYYRIVGLPERQIQQIAASPFARGNMLVCFSALGIALLGGYLFYVRRYFHGPASRVVPA